jgi:hypothetical protein
MFNAGEKVRVYDNGCSFTATVLYEDDDRMGNTWVYLHPDVTNITHNPKFIIEDYSPDGDGFISVMKKLVTITPL